MPWLLKYPRSYHSVSPTFLPRIVSLLTFQPSSSACNVVIRLFLLCRRAGRYCYLRNLRASTRLQAFHQIDFYYDVGALFQIIFHCVYHPFFILAPTDYHLFPETVPSLLATIHLLQRPTDLVSMALFCMCPIWTTPPPRSSCRSSRQSQNISSSFVSCFFQDSPEIHIHHPLDPTRLLMLQLVPSY